MLLKQCIVSTSLFEFSFCTFWKNWMWKKLVLFSLTYSISLVSEVGLFMADKSPNNVWINYFFYCNYIVFMVNQWFRNAVFVQNVIEIAIFVNIKNDPLATSWHRWLASGIAFTWDNHNNGNCLFGLDCKMAPASFSAIIISVCWYSSLISLLLNLQCDFSNLFIFVVGEQKMYPLEIFPNY